MEMLTCGTGSDQLNSVDTRSIQTSRNLESLSESIARQLPLIRADVSTSATSISCLIEKMHNYVVGHPDQGLEFASRSLLQSSGPTKRQMPRRNPSEWSWFSIILPIGILAIESWRDAREDKVEKISLGFQVVPWAWISNIGVQTSWSIMMREYTVLDWQRVQDPVKHIVPRALDDALKDGNLFEAGSILLALPVEQLKRMADSKAVSYKVTAI